jgi:hypothetical protein
MTEEIVGLDVLWAWPCRCGCPKTRIALHSKVSKLLIWKCPLVREAPRQADRRSHQQAKGVCRAVWLEHATARH